MDDGRATLSRTADLVRQMGEVSRQNRGCEFDQTWALAQEILGKFYHVEKECRTPCLQLPVVISFA
jgi:hypothetical protein